MPVVFIGAGVVTSVPEKGKDGEKDHGMVSPFGRHTVEVTQLQTAIVHGKYIGFKKLKSKLAQGGASSPGGLAAYVGRKKYGREKFQRAAAAGRTMR
jgi:hypothetical protein